MPLLRSRKVKWQHSAVAEQHTFSFEPAKLYCKKCGTELANVKAAKAKCKVKG